MTAGSIILGIALFIAVLTYLAYPFWGHQEPERRGRRSKAALLTEQKEAILAQIRVLDFDFETGKLPESAHAAQRAQLLAEATAVLQELDALGGGPPEKSEAAIEAAIARARRPQPAGDDDLESAIEAAISRARRKTVAPEAAAPIELAAPTELATLSAGAAPAAAPVLTVADANGRQPRFCPQCGQRVQAGDKFCVSCGHNLQVQASES